MNDNIFHEQCPKRKDNLLRSFHPKKTFIGKLVYVYKAKTKQVTQIYMTCTF